MMRARGADDVEVFTPADVQKTTFSDDRWHFKKMEGHAAAEAIRLRKPNHGKLHLIGPAIGVVIVVLLAAWMAYHWHKTLNSSSS
jgi:hypothetical protein